MKKVITFAVLMAGLAAVPASATEVGLILDRQMGKAQAISSALGGVNKEKFEGVGIYGVGIRASLPVLDLKVAALSLTGTYHPEVHSDLVVNGGKRGTYSHSYAAVGAEATWKFLLDVNAGVDLRQEKLQVLYNSYHTSQTYLRPWLRAGVGMNLPLPILKPFVRLEAAIPVTRKDSTDTADATTKALAPALQLAVYGGIRF